MYLLTRRLRLLFLALFVPVFLIACGKSQNQNISSQVFWGHSAVLDVDGAVWTWGANGCYQLGNGSNDDRDTPAKLTTVAMQKIAIGGKHTLALDSTGTLESTGSVWSWGYNLNGQLGDNSTTTRSTPVKITFPDGIINIKSIAAGASHSLAVDSSNNVLAWGYNNKGQLGLGTGTNKTVDQKSPMPVQDLPSGNVQEIAAGGDFSLALIDGTVYAWGNNTKGQLGVVNTVTDVTTQFSPTPNPVKTLNSDLTNGVALTGIIKIAAGGSHALAIDSAGNIWAWGNNQLGQLGDGTKGNYRYGARIVSSVITNPIATEVSAGLDHSLAIMDGSVYACGYNFYGQTGNGVSGNNDPVTSLQQVHSDITLPTFSSIVAVGDHSIAKTNVVGVSFSYWTWGRNTYGQLGDGTKTDRSTPKSVLSFP